MLTVFSANLTLKAVSFIIFLEEVENAPSHVTVCKMCMHSAVISVFLNKLSLKLGSFVWAIVC